MRVLGVRRTSRVAGVALAAGAAAQFLVLSPGVSVTAATGVEPLTTTVRDVARQGGVAGLFAAGRQLLGGDRSLRLQRAARNPLVGFESPVVRASQDGQTLAYDTWNRALKLDRLQTLETQGVHTGRVLGIPQVRIRNRRTGRERALEAGTMSPSFRADGALAYVRGQDAAYRANTTYFTEVVVRGTGRRARATRWSEDADRFSVVGWSGRLLLVSRSVPGHGPDLVVFSGPGAARVIAQDTKVVAISPDGESVLVAAGVTRGPGGASVQLIRVTDGAVLASRPVAELSDARTQVTVGRIGGPGQWLGDRVVASTDTGFAVLAVHPGAISVERLVGFDLSGDGGGLASIREPRFGDAAGDTVTGHSIVGGNTDAPRFGATYVCRWREATCSRQTFAPLQTPRPVGDLSSGFQRRSDSARVPAAPAAAPPPVTVAQTLDPTTIVETQVGSTPQVCAPRVSAPAIDRAPTVPHINVSAEEEQASDEANENAQAEEQAANEEEPHAHEEPAASDPVPALCGSTGPAQWYTQFHFYKYSVTNSDLYIRRYKYDTGTLAGESMTRAGSGVYQDTCIPNEGWLPTGWYTIRQHINKKNDTIKGRVWWLSDKACGSGQLRSELFIHTEETANGGQSTDERYSWDGAEDYKSNGCIKVSHTDMDLHHRLWSDWDGRHDSFTANNALRVYN